jgi:hypothetical protein
LEPFFISKIQARFYKFPNTQITKQMQYFC